jgi:hypothetical protein
MPCRRGWQSTDLDAACPSTDVIQRRVSTWGGTQPQIVNAHPDLLLERSGDAVSREEVLHHVSRHVLDRALSSGQLAELLPKTYVRRELGADIVVREQAALLYAGPHAALSHLSALRRWGLPVPSTRQYT